LLNLNDPKIFPQKYFTDSVHLNTRGGEHFFQVLADRLKADPETAAIIGQAGVGSNSSITIQTKLTRSVLEGLPKSATVQDIVKLAGPHHSDIGSGLHILTYPLADGSWAMIGTPDMKAIMYIHFQQSEPKSGFEK
jgi:hypothetical protein